MEKCERLSRNFHSRDGFFNVWFSIFEQVGRIIGKGGQNVRELQRVTGSIIKLPEHGTAPAEEETTVHIIGPFFSVQVSCNPFGFFSVHRGFSVSPEVQQNRGIFVHFSILFLFLLPYSRHNVVSAQ